jgi:hypothetical protein
MAFVASVAEKSFTGMETSPNETVSDAIDRDAMGPPLSGPLIGDSSSDPTDALISILDQMDTSCH